MGNVLFWTPELHLFTSFFLKGAGTHHLKGSRSRPVANSIVRLSHWEQNVQLAGLSPLPALGHSFASGTTDQRSRGVFHARGQGWAGAREPSLDVSTAQGSLRGNKPPPPPEGWEGALPRAEKSRLIGPEPRPLLNKPLFISGSNSPTVFTSWGRRSNLPQTGWLETTEMYLLAVLEARNPGSRCRQGLTLGEAGGSKASCFPPSPTFRRPPLAGPGLAHSSLPRLHRAVLSLRCVCLPLLSPQHATHCTQARPPSTVI